MNEPTRPDRLPSAAKIEEQAQAAGLSIPDLCAAVGVAPSTFYRWRGGAKISADLLQRFMDAVVPPVAKKRRA
jgi:AcrR family transcriptional regulator